MLSEIFKCSLSQEKMDKRPIFKIHLKDVIMW
jgi:hypothetical protein